MKWIFIFLIGSYGFAQQVKQPIDPIFPKYKIEGKIMYTSFHQGGAQKEDIQPRPEYPKPNFTLYIVEYLGPDQKPKLWDRITTGENGCFSTEVKSGKFGFVLDYKNADLGQFLPKGYQDISQYYSESSNWEISGNKPIEVIDESITGIRLVKHTSSICMECP